MSRAIVLLAAVWSATVFAQSDRGRISGRVLDPTGAVVPSAIVTVENPLDWVSMGFKPVAAFWMPLVSSLEALSPFGAPFGDWNAAHLFLLSGSFQGSKFKKSEMAQSVTKAEARIEELAHQIMKRDGLSFGQAYTKALEQEPQLYSQFLEQADEIAKARKRKGDDDSSAMTSGKGGQRNNDGTTMRLRGRPQDEEEDDDEDSDLDDEDDDAAATAKIVKSAAKSRRSNAPPATRKTIPTPIFAKDAGARYDLAGVGSL